MIKASNNDVHLVCDETMNRIYSLINTPYKLGAVVKMNDDLTDSPSVFRLGDKYYMMHLAISKECATSGYRTVICESEDLVNWKNSKIILDRNGSGNWDSKQIAGYLGLCDISFDEIGEPERLNGSYVVSYLGGNADGYEPKPLFMGLALTDNLLDKKSYRRLPNPVLSPNDNDARLGEKSAVFRSFIFRDKKLTLGYPFVMVYNAKDEKEIERIYLAVSNDCISFERYGEEPIIDGTKTDSLNKISADAQILLIDDVYVMVYFKYNYDKPAYSTFACSRDLIHWKEWDKTPLIKSEFAFENKHAHKSWLVRHNGITYNYYCAVNDKDERFIALAVSDKKIIKNSKTI